MQRGQKGCKKCANGHFFLSLRATPELVSPRAQRELWGATHTHSSGCVMFSFGDQEAPAKTAANKKKSRRVSLADRSRSGNDENAMPSTPRRHRGLAGKGASLQTQQQAFIQVCVRVWS